MKSIQILRGLKFKKIGTDGFREGGSERKLIRIAPKVDLEPEARKLAVEGQIASEVELETYELGKKGLRALKIELEAESWEENKVDQSWCLRKRSLKRRARQGQK